MDTSAVIEHLESKKAYHEGRWAVFSLILMCILLTVDYLKFTPWWIIILLILIFLVGNGILISRATLYLRVRDYVVQHIMFSNCLNNKKQYILVLRSFTQKDFYYNRKNPPLGTGVTGARSPAASALYGENEINTLKQLEQNLDSDIIFVYFSNISQIEGHDCLRKSLFLLHNDGFDWLSIVNELATKASAIFFLPEISDGIIEEAKIFTHRYKEKIFFLSLRQLRQVKKRRLKINGR